MELREALMQYKDYTIKLIHCAENEEFDSIENLLNCREDIITAIKGLSFSQEEVRGFLKELNIMDLEEELKSIMIEKKDSVRKKMERVLQNTNANMQYSKKDYTKPAYFNEKV